MFESDLRSKVWHTFLLFFCNLSVNGWSLCRGAGMRLCIFVQKRDIASKMRDFPVPVAPVITVKFGCGSRRA